MRITDTSNISSMNYEYGNRPNRLSASAAIAKWIYDEPPREAAPQTDLACATSARRRRNQMRGA